MKPQAPDNIDPPAPMGATNAATNTATAAASNTPDQQASAQVIALRPPSRWHDPLQLMQEKPPSHIGRIVLWSVSLLCVILIGWAAMGQLDIIATAEGKLATQTLIKIVQPAEAGVVKELLVKEGDVVKAGQVLARLDPTLAQADKKSIASELALQHLQARRMAAELAGQPMLPQAGDDPTLYAQVHRQYIAHRQAYLDGIEQEKSLLAKAEHEQKSAVQILAKLEQSLPTYQKTAAAYARLEKEGFIAGIAAADKQREAMEKSKDFAAQQSTVAAVEATIAAQQQRIQQLRSTYHSELEKELAEVRAKIAQLQPSLDKTRYKEGLLELKAPQDGVVKELATTTIGAVVQPGAVVVSLVPQGEPLFADVQIKNDDIGFVQAGQSAHIKLAAYPFQKYGMLSGKVIHVSADASEPTQAKIAERPAHNDSSATAMPTYKARIALERQTLTSPYGQELALTPGMQVTVEIHQGKRTVLEYLLSPVQKAVREAGRER